jgi:hypothetical protein
LGGVGGFLYIVCAFVYMPQINNKLLSNDLATLHEAANERKGMNVTLDFTSARRFKNN